MVNLESDDLFSRLPKHEVVLIFFQELLSRLVNSEYYIAHHIQPSVYRAGIT